jgi:competence protein ComEA
MMKKLFITTLLASMTLFAFDINSATKEDLMKVKGIGAKKAEKIVAYRKEHGKFKNADELVNVKGISKKIVEKIKSFKG